MNERIKLPRDVIRAIEHLSYDCGMSSGFILEIHKGVLKGNKDKWRGKAEYLNELDYETLEKALNKGFVIDTSLDGINPDLKKKTIDKTKRLYNSIKALEAELDYELLSLHEAIKSNDVKSIERIKKRLAEIHKELGLGLKK